MPKMGSKKSILLRCYVRPSGHDNRYIGVCLTLNLVVEGISQREAAHKLKSLVHAYLADAVENDEYDAFVPRRAPFRYYAEYAFCCVIEFFRMFKREPGYCAFTDQHMIPSHGSGLAAS